VNARTGQPTANAAPPATDAPAAADDEPTEEDATASRRAIDGVTLVHTPLPHTPIDRERFRELLHRAPVGGARAPKEPPSVVHVVNSSAELDVEVERWQERSWT
jgi:hypothetical protein